MSRKGNEDKEKNINFDKIEKEIESKKKLPKEEKDKINKKVFENIIIAIAITIYLILLSLLSLNIASDVFFRYLKVLSIVFIVLTISLFEYSYKRDNGNICIHGIEAFFLALFTLFSIYIYAIYFRNYQFIVCIFLISCDVYYLMKSIIISRKMKRKYFAKMNDISEIIKK